MANGRNQRQAGPITQQEYNRRRAQSQRDKRNASNNNNGRSNGRKRKRGARARAPRVRFSSNAVSAATPRTAKAADPCLLDYAKSLSNPFDMSLTPCAPLQASRRTWKFSSFARGTFAATAPGLGYVSVDPYMMYRPVSLGTIFATSGTGTPGSGTALNNTGSYDVDTYPGASPNGQTIGNNLTVGGKQVRLVSAGVRVKCASPPTTTKGVVIACRSTENGSMENASATTLLDNPRAVIKSAQECMDEWFGVNWAPGPQDDLGFYDAEASFPSRLGSSYTDQRGPLIILASGAASGQVFYWEAVAHFEFVSQVTGAYATPSSYSPLGQSVASAFAEMAPGFAAQVQQSAVRALREQGIPALTALAARLMGGSVTRTVRSIM